MNEVPAAQQSVSIVAVSVEGLVGRGDTDAVLDVLLDGRLVWSLRFLRDSEPAGAQRLVAWPAVLRPYLDGVAAVRVREHASGAVLYDREMRFGASDHRIAVVDGAGNPLSVTAKGHLAALLSQRGPHVLETVLDAAEDVLAILRAEGVDGFVVYGTLLGAVRSGHVIAHDYDADLSYLTEREFPVDAIGESYRLERAIIASGYAVRRYSSMAFQVGLNTADASHPWLDVFGSIIVGDMLYVLWDVGAPLRRDQVVPLGSCTLEGRELPAPREAEAWLAATYGPSWRIPDPSFAFDTPRSVTRRLSGWFGRLNRGKREWNELHGDSDVRDEPSDFVRWVSGCEPDADVVADLGCGLGTDSLWLAQGSSQRTVLGLDFSTVALARASARAAQSGSGATFEPVSFTDLRSVLVTAARLARLPGRRVLTARLLADGLTEAERSYLWLLSRMVLRDGGLMYLETTMPRDPRHAAFAAANRLRKLPAPTLRAELEAAGATITERQVVPSPPQSDVPDTMRMVLSWSS